MSRVTECKEEGCNRPPLDRVPYCADHIGARRRCKKIRVKDGREQRCKKQALIGLDVCEVHGGRFPNSAALVKRSVALSTMQRFVRPREGSVSLLEAFEEEFRRTLGRIDWLNEQIGLLASEDDLIWGMTKREDIGAGEEPGTNVTYEAKVHLLEEMLRWERVHLLNIEKLGIGAGLEQQRLDLLKTYSSRIRVVIEQAFEALGMDAKDPKVIAALQRAIAPQSAIIDVEQL